MAVAEAYHARSRVNFGTGQRLARRIERDPLLVALAREQIRLLPSALKDSDHRLVMTHQFHGIVLLLANVLTDGKQALDRRHMHMLSHAWPIVAARKRDCQLVH